MTEPLLRVRDLTVNLRVPSTVILEGIDLDLGRRNHRHIGRIGSRETTLAKALLRLLLSQQVVVNGSIRLRETGDPLRQRARPARNQRRADLLDLSGARASPQSSSASEQQVSEVLRAHSGWTAGIDEKKLIRC